MLVQQRQKAQNGHESDLLLTGKLGGQTIIQAPRCLSSRLCMLYYLRRFMLEMAGTALVLFFVLCAVIAFLSSDL
jgi:hypothetical protein